MKKNDFIKKTNLCNETIKLCALNFLSTCKIKEKPMTKIIGLRDVSGYINEESRMMEHMGFTLESKCSDGTSYWTLNGIEKAVCCVNVIDFFDQQINTLHSHMTINLMRNNHFYVHHGNTIHFFKKMTKIYKMVEKMQNNLGLSTAMDVTMKSKYNGKNVETELINLAESGKVKYNDILPLLSKTNVEKLSTVSSMENLKF